MSEGGIRIMLATLAAMLLAIGIVQLAFIDATMGGLGTITVALCLIVVVSSTRKKQNHG